ncbi:MAG: tetratricopeptide repeat protein [bacterium]|nr:tetratricopeptide repeat protein [bacterium]
MSNLLVIVAVAVVAAVAGVLWSVFGRTEERDRGSDYLHALEHWLAGEEDEALRLLTEVVREDPSSVEPYLQLGHLLRQRGDAARAAVLHRGLTVRPGLSKPQRVAIGVALAEDLLALERWDEAQEVLDGLVRDATGRTAYWRARFAQWHGQGNRPEAARSLQKAPRFCPERDHAWFRTSYTAYQLDRALEHARAGESGPARARLKDVAKFPSAAPRAALVRAVLAATEQDAAGALTVAAEELLENPRELEVFLPLLQDVLLESGQFSRSLPILERACQSAQAPARLWISLALLYEKLGDREKALRLLEGKATGGGLTPDVASPYLKHLCREASDTDLGKLCAMLSIPNTARVWTCESCGRTEPQVRWFCPVCRGFDTYGAGLETT